ncbi:MAG: hypothetical protein H6619_00620 [Deltaproteobacteria bacterium]|nr:hypothetical protein [Deltaproteobacteria bacterium]
MARFKYYALIAQLLFAVNVLAFDKTSFFHIPPEFVDSQKIELSISAEGIKRARVLLSDSAGILPIEMAIQEDSNELTAKFDPSDLALIKYQFQIQADDNTLFESPYYYIRRPAADSLEAELSAYNKEYDLVNKKIRQVKNAIYNLQEGNLVTRKSQELGRAVLMLRDAEKEFVKQQVLASTLYEEITLQQGITPRGQLVQNMRNLIAKEQERLWGEK